MNPDIQNQAKEFCKTELQNFKETNLFSQEILEAIIARIIKIEDADQRWATFALWSTLPGAVGNASQFRQFLIKQNLLTPEGTKRKGVSLAAFGL